MSDMLEMFPSCCTSLTSLNVRGFSHGGIRAAEGALSTGSGIGWSCDYRLRLSHRSVPRCPVPSTWCWVRDRTCRQTWLMSTQTHTHTPSGEHRVRLSPSEAWRALLLIFRKKKKKGSKMTFCYEGWYDTSLLLRKLISGMNRKTDNTFLLEQSGTSGNIYFILLEKESATTFNLQSQSERHGGGKEDTYMLFISIYLSLKNQYELGMFSKWVQW